MVVIQSICARIGRTTGRGLAGNLRKFYPRWLLITIVGLLFVANTLNIGADLGAMGAAMRLLIPQLPAWFYVGAFGAMSAVAQVVLQYTRYVAALKWLTLSLFAYFATLAVVHVSWRDLLLGLVWPAFSNSQEFWMMVVAILGTTISPYLFFWQAAQEVEDTKADPVRVPLLQNPRQAKRALARIQVDTLVGMGFSNLVALAILVTGAATLHASGVTQIDTAAQAAEDCALSREPSHLQSSRWASSAQASCPFPCWPVPRPTPWAKPKAGKSASPSSRSKPRHFTVPSWRQPCSGPSPTSSN